MEFQLKTDFIELDNMLKALHLVGSGARTRQCIQSGLIKINRQVETNARSSKTASGRFRRIRPGAHHSHCEMINNNIEYDLGPQPLAKLMAEHGLKPNDLVSNSTEQLTHKMAGRAVKGRRLTPNVQYKVLNALNKAAGKQYRLKDLFNYD